MDSTIDTVEWPRLPEAVSLGAPVLSFVTVQKGLKAPALEPRKLSWMKQLFKPVDCIFVAFLSHHIPSYLLNLWSRFFLG